MSRRLRIAMVAACPFPFPRGTPIRIRGMAEVLAKRGHDVHVVTYHRDGGDDRALPFAVHRTPRIGVASPGAPGPTWRKLLVLDPLLAHTLARVLRSGRFDLIHAHHYEGLVTALAARALLRIPIVYDAHTMLVSELHHYALGFPRWITRAIAHALERRLPHRADHVVAVSEDIRAKLTSEFALCEDSATVVPSGVDLSHFEQPIAPGASAPHRTIVFTGNLAAYQGIDLLLDAFERLRARRQDVRLRLVAEAALDARGSAIDRAAIRDHVDLVVSDFAALPHHLGSADVAAHPRIECDGQPQKLLNYMAAGMPIVSFAGSARGIVDGQNGLVVTDGDVEGFAAALDRLLCDRALAQRLGVAAREYARSALGWERAAITLERVYERVLAADGARC